MSPVSPHDFSVVTFAREPVVRHFPCDDRWVVQRDDDGEGWTAYGPDFLKIHVVYCWVCGSNLEYDYELWLKLGYGK